MVKVIIYPCLVQGTEAADSICEGIEYFNEKKPVDLIITGRGGGSIEDLWAFNEEKTARAVAASVIPVISAVGHEVDFTICDFVSDLRAPTPSAAAELAVPDITELKRNIITNNNRMSALLKNKVSTQERQLELISKRSVLTQFDKFLLDKEQGVDTLLDRCSLAFKNKKQVAEELFGALCGKLSALSPLAVLERGYSSTTKDGKSVKTVSELQEGDNVVLRLADGEADCLVTGRREFDEI